MVDSRAPSRAGSSDALTDALSGVARLLHRPSAAEQVADVLREQIVNGALRSGTRLTEETISAALGFSRNTIREGFALLIAERIVVRESNRGVFVARPTVSDIRDLYATRMLIEPSALEHGPGFTPAAVAALRKIVERARTAHASLDSAGVAQANQHFHRSVGHLGGSKRVDQLMSGVLAEMRLVFHLMDDTQFHVPYIERNDEIVTLLESGDRTAAATAMRAYLVAAEEHLLSAVGAATKPH